MIDSVHTSFYAGSYWQVVRDEHNRVVRVMEHAPGHGTFDAMLIRISVGELGVVCRDGSKLALSIIEKAPHAELSPEFLPRTAERKAPSTPESVADVIIEFVRAEVRYAAENARIERMPYDHPLIAPGADPRERNEAERRLRSMLEDFFPHAPMSDFTHDELAVLLKAVQHTGCNCGDNQCWSDAEEALLGRAVSKVAALVPHESQDAIEVAYVRTMGGVLP